MDKVSRVMFPYGMEKNQDGTWTLFNRQYKPLGIISKDWEIWDDPKHKLSLKGLGPSTLLKLDVNGEGKANRIYFYNDGCVPTASAQGMNSYLEKMRILMGIKIERKSAI
jgi:hypothetical protein